MWGSDSYLVGTVLGGSRDVIPRFDDQVKEFLWRKLSKHNQSGNDQIMLMAMLCERPETFRLVYSAKVYEGVTHLYTHLALLERDILQFVDPQVADLASANSSMVPRLSFSDKLSAEKHATGARQPIPLFL